MGRIEVMGRADINGRVDAKGTQTESECQSINVLHKKLHYDGVQAEVRDWVDITGRLDIIRSVDAVRKITRTSQNRTRKRTRNRNEQQR